MRHVEPAPAAASWCPDGIESRDRAAPRSPTSSTASAPRRHRRRRGRRPGAAQGVDRRRGLRGYDDHHDDLPGDATSRLSPYLHFGCLSPLEVLPTAAPAAARARTRSCASCAGATSTPRSSPPGPTPRTPTTADRGDRWRDDPTTSCRRGRTAAPATRSSTPGCASSAREGFMHNRARMVVASFLAKDLYLDWRVGAAPLPRPARRRRPRQQPAQLAVGRRHRHRHQRRTACSTRRAGPALRPRRRLRAPLRARAARRSRTAPSTTPTPEVGRAYDYPDPVVDHREAIAEYKDQPRPQPTTCVGAAAQCSSGRRGAVGTPSAMVPTNWLSWRRLRHS